MLSGTEPTHGRQLVRQFSDSDLEGREPLPEKNFFLTNSPSFIEHRRWRLEMYINALAHCPVIAHSDLFKEFLEYDQARSHLQTRPAESSQFPFMRIFVFYLHFDALLA